VAAGGLTAVGHSQEFTRLLLFVHFGLANPRTWPPLILNVAKYVPVMLGEAICNAGLVCGVHLTL